MPDRPDIVEEAQRQFGEAALTPQPTCDGVPTFWAPAARVCEVLRWLKRDVRQPYAMLYDLSAVDERERAHRSGQPPADFTLVYHLRSLDRAADLRVKVPLRGEAPSVPTVTGIWPAANWYEREVWDMFGITVEGHPHLGRILMPPWWEGHPLRKEHPARATDMEPFEMPPERHAALQEQLLFRPEEWGWAERGEDFDYMILNVGPHHPGTHGMLRVIVQMEGQEITDLLCDIGYHHRGAEKMGERQSWHTFIPYTDRIDYLGGVMNNLPYVLSVEKLAGIEVPDRAKVIRIMMAELFRVISHLVFYGTMAQDVGIMSSVFYMFTDRERAFDIVEAVTGARMHPGWFRIGGVAMDLPQGWEQMVRDFVSYMRRRMRDYDAMVMENSIFKARTVGVGCVTAQEAVDWGATGPFLRGSGVEWDLRKRMPYGGYEQFEFDVPTGPNGDCYDRTAVHVEEIRQSLRIIEQCADNMPAGPYKSLQPGATPPLKERTMQDIETLIHHFLSVSWGPVVPPGEAVVPVEATKGNNSYYLISDGGTSPYRVRIRAPSFAHIQKVPMMSRGLMLPDLVAVLGAVDFVLADVDR
jgi:NADH-quinone oxidoreductase subunit C/D